MIKVTDPGCGLIKGCFAVNMHFSVAGTASLTESRSCNCVCCYSDNIMTLWGNVLLVRGCYGNSDPAWGKCAAGDSVRQHQPDTTHGTFPQPFHGEQSLWLHLSLVSSVCLFLCYFQQVRVRVRVRCSSKKNVNDFESLFLL